MVLLCKANGKSFIKENIFENRFMHVAELTEWELKFLLKVIKQLVKGNINFSR